MRDLVRDLVVPTDDAITRLLDSSFLIAGYCPDPVLIEIECAGKATDYTGKGFHAIGSGALPAQIARGMLRHLNPSLMTLEQAKAHAWRLVSSVIDHYDSGIGYPVKMATITEQSGAVLITDDELDAIKEVVELWRETERDALSAMYEQPVNSDELDT